MIDKVYAAPKYIRLEDGIDFALANQTCYEIPSFLSPAVLDNKNEEIAKYRELLKNFKGTLSLHGPIYDMNPVSLDPAIAESSKNRYYQAIDVCEEMNVKYLVFHSQYSPIFNVANVENEWLAQNVDYWQEIIDTKLKDKELVLLIENFMDENPDLINTLVDRVNSPNLKICLDTGHVNLFSEVPPIDWLDEFGNNVVYIHAHNNYGEKDDHKAFQKGSIDMEGFLNHLVLLPHKVNLALEVFDLEGIQESFDMTAHYLKMQKEQTVSKSFLI